MASDTPVQPHWCMRGCVLTGPCKPGTCKMAERPDTPAPPAEPSDEALIDNHHESVARRYMGKAPCSEVEKAQEALRARLASKDKHIAELEAIVNDAQLARDTAGFLGSIGACIRRLDSNLTAAEAALAECRAKVIEECAEAADTPETTNDFQRGMCFAATMIRALATKESTK